MSVKFSDIRGCISFFLRPKQMYSTISFLLVMVMVSDYPMLKQYSCLLYILVLKAILFYSTVDWWHCFLQNHILVLFCLPLLHWPDVNMEMVTGNILVFFWSCFNVRHDTSVFLVDDLYQIWVKFPCILSFQRVVIMHQSWILSNEYSVFVEVILCSFCPSVLFMWWIK